jgi:hypothetical protein
VEREEFEIVLELILEAVREQLLDPIVQVLFPIALSSCKNRDDRLVLAEAIKRQISDWPEDTFATHYLEWLSGQLASENIIDPSGSDKSLNTFLKIVKKDDPKPD